MTRALIAEELLSKLKSNVCTGKFCINRGFENAMGGSSSIGLSILKNRSCC